MCERLFSVDCGDYVVVTNAKNIKVTGRKDEQLVYRKHTMFPGGLKETEYKDMMDNKPYEVGCILVISAYTTRLPRDCANVDHTARCLRHVTQKQASGTSVGATQSIWRVKYGDI
jgi:hypothetical protein